MIINHIRSELSSTRRQEDITSERPPTILIRANDVFRMLFDVGKDEKINTRLENLR